jgi:putative membrane protein
MTLWRANDHRSLGLAEVSVDLGAKLHVVPAHIDTSASLKKQAAETSAHLKTLKRATFDKAYMDDEVGYHKA